MVPWTDDYSVKVPEFDQHHRQLFRLVDDLHQAMKAGQGKQSMAKILNELIRYTEMHFAAEESALIGANYKEFSAHQAEHDKLRARVGAFQKDFASGSAGLSIGLMEFLNDWLVNHIIKTDQRYSAVLAGKS
jgi:hemerythrin